jgi:uncharacterized membrane protein
MKQNLKHFSSNPIEFIIIIVLVWQIKIRYTYTHHSRNIYCKELVHIVTEPGMSQGVWGTHKIESQICGSILRDGLRHGCSHVSCHLWTNKNLLF